MSTTIMQMTTSNSTSVKPLAHVKREPDFRETDRSVGVAMSLSSIFSGDEMEIDGERPPWMGQDGDVSPFNLYGYPINARRRRISPRAVTRPKMARVAGSGTPVGSSVGAPLL